MNTEKICRVCQRIKKLHDFSLAPGNKDGYSHRCKECVATHAKQYYKTLPGLITHIYNTELSSSKARKHPKPTYSKKELTNWLYEQGILLQYEVWKNSGYLKDLRPSVDRIDSTKPYSLKNIRLVTWKENNEAAYIERKVCKRITVQCREINQLNNDGEVLATFKSVALASRITGIQRTNINACCSGKVSHKAGGFYWEYAA